MLGTIIGDIVGSRFEWNNNKSKEFEFFTQENSATDDSVMSIAIGNALLECREDKSMLEKKAIFWMQFLGRKYPDVGYGGKFKEWINSENPKPYNSYGNGAAMRVGACGFVAETRKEALELSDIVTKVTHNHSESIKAARAVTECIFAARCGIHKDDIKALINKEYYPMNFTLDDIRKDYSFDVSCQGSVPQALEAFFEANTFEEVIRNAVSIGGDSDTIAAIAGSIGEAYYGVSQKLWLKAGEYLGEELFNMMNSFQFAFCGLRNIDPKDLEDGKMLLELKDEYIQNPNNENLGPFLSCLRDSYVFVPFDKETNKVSLTSNLNNYYFPIFSHDSQIPDMYKEHFKLKKIKTLEAVELAKEYLKGQEKKIAGMSLDGFTNPVDISFEWMGIMRDLCSRLKLSWTAE